ncbi:hypothetical protein B0H13DRAFT_1637196, partial [Mycena leptocephala]
QIPLTLAWAMSVHKAQGQSLNRVKVDLKNAFAPGLYPQMMPRRALSLSRPGVCGPLPCDFA